MITATAAPISRMAGSTISKKLNLGERTADGGEETVATDLSYTQAMISPPKQAMHLISPELIYDISQVCLLSIHKSETEND